MKYKEYYKNQTPWIEVNDLSGDQYSVNKNIRFKTPVLRSDLRDYSDARIVVKRTVNLLVAAANENDKAQKDVAFKNDAPFRSCISKINNTLIDMVEDLDIVMSMYSLLEYSDNYSMTSGSLWNYYRDEVVDVDDNTSASKSFEYKKNNNNNKKKIVGKTLGRPPQPGNPGDMEIQHDDQYQS